MSEIYNPIYRADQIKIADAGEYYTGTDVEDALQEIGAGTTLDGRYLKLDASNDPITGDLTIQPDTNSTTALQVNKSDGTNVFGVDTDNEKLLWRSGRARLELRSYDFAGFTDIPYLVPSETFFNSRLMLIEGGLFLSQNETTLARIYFSKGNDVNTGFQFTYADDTDILDLTHFALPNSIFRVKVEALFQSQSNNKIPLTVQGSATQDANLAEFQDSSENVLASVEADGTIQTEAGLRVDAFSSAGFVKNDASGNLVGGNTISTTDISDLATTYLKLDASNAPLTGDLTLSDGLKIATDAVYARDGDGLKLYDDGGNGIFVKDGGYVGIGTATPEKILHIYENVAGYSTLRLQNPNSGTTSAAYLDIKSDTANFQIFAFSSNLSNANWTNKAVLYAPGSTDAIQFWKTGNKPIEFWTNSTERMRIDGSGRVGIGTNSPTAKVDVNSDIIRLRTSKTPSSASAAGNTGDICWDSSYAYICVASNTWKRAAISTW